MQPLVTQRRDRTQPWSLALNGLLLLSSGVLLSSGLLACSSDNASGGNNAGSGGNSMGGSNGNGGSGARGGAAGAGGSPAASDILCGRRPGGTLYGKHVLRFETTGGDVVQLALDFEDSGVGESALFRLEAMGVRLDGAEICIDSSDRLEYENTHHNWDDVARGIKGGVTYEVKLVSDSVDTLSVFDQSGGEVLEPTPLIWTGTPPFCANCQRPLWLGISEIVANNASILVDQASEFEPLIELYNTGADDIDLRGWTLSNDFAERRQWALPSVTIRRHQMLVLFADGDLAQGPLHTSFELNPNGGELILTAPDGSTDGGFVYGPQLPDKSLSFSWSTGSYVELDTPTPGKPPPE